MSFALYLIGVLIMLGGLIWAAVLLQVPGPWIGIGALVLGGLGVLSAVARTRSRDGTAKPRRHAEW